MWPKIVIGILALIALALGISIVLDKDLPSLSNVSPAVNDLVGREQEGEEGNEVASSSEVLNTAEAKCLDADSTNFDCYETYYTKLVKESGIVAAFSDLRNRYKTNSYVQSQCHPLTHVIGRVAAEGLENPGEAFPKGDAFCWSGYYHGVLEGVIGKIGLQNLPSKINTICSTIPGKERYSFDYYNCVHGLGHGVMAITQNELFKSLEYCDRMTGTWEQKSCASGAFMENVIADQINHSSKYLRPSEPLYPCTATPEKYKEICYLMQTSYILKVTNGDFQKTFAWCRQAESEHQNTCFASLGRDASGRSVSKVEPTKNVCLLGNPGDEQTYCVIGAVKDFISYYHSDVQAKALCDSFTGSLRETCLSTAESYYQIF